MLVHIPTSCRPLPPLSYTILCVSFLPENGFWLDPIRHTAICSGDSCALCRLTNPNHPSYITPQPTSPGVGLPGILWNESKASTTHRGISGHGKNSVAWRNVRSLAQDPDQPTDARLSAFVEAGLGWAAGIPFINGNEAGIVIFIARDGIDRQIKTRVNEAYLIAASDLVGSAWALRFPRHAAVEAREDNLARAVRVARAKLLSLIRMGVKIDDLVKPPPTEAQMQGDVLDLSFHVQHIRMVIPRLIQYTTSKIKQVYVKSRYGGMNQPPPANDFTESTYSAIGTFTAILIVCELSEYMVQTYGLDYSIMVGPFGALAMLQFSLTSAPAAQPRNAFVAQVLALPIGIGMGQTGLQRGIRQSIAAAITVFLTSILGIVHPPAGAVAVAFSGASELGWSEMGTFLMGYVVIIGFAVIANNLNEKRQYPAYWGVGFILDYFKKDNNDKVDIGGHTGKFA